MTDDRTQGIEHAAGPGLDRQDPMHRVLVEFNGTDAACAALRGGIQIALSFHAQLTITGVVESPPSIAYAATEPIAMPYSPQALQRELAAEMERHLAAARDEIPASANRGPHALQALAGEAFHRLAAGLSRVSLTR